VTATHTTAHTNHKPGLHEDMYLPLPKSVKFVIAVEAHQWRTCREDNGR